MTASEPFRGVEQSQLATHVYRAGVVTLSDYAARVVVAAMDALFAKVAGEGAQPYPQVIAIRNLIFERVTRAETHVDASAEVSGVGELLALGADAVVGTAAAARTLEISEDGVRDLCRRGRLDASRLGSRWLVSVESLEEYRVARGGKRLQRNERTA